MVSHGHSRLDFHYALRCVVQQSCAEHQMQETIWSARSGDWWLFVSPEGARCIAVAEDPVAPPMTRYYGIAT